MRHEPRYSRPVTYRPRRMRTRRGRRSPYPALTIVVAVLGLGVIAWMLTWGTSDEPETSSVTPTAVAAEPQRAPTARFAAVGDVELHLPVDPSAITALAFHQASGDRAQAMTALIPDVTPEAAEDPEALAAIAATADGDDEIWAGACLRLWRTGRGGEPDTAADFGALPDTDIYSPVTGTVIAVRPYLLYEKHDDIEIHIRPDGADDLDVVLIHVTDPSVEAGDRVLGGVTRIAAIRKMSGLIELQLAGYTGDGGDHVHMQVNRIGEPGEADEPGGS